MEKPRLILQTHSCRPCLEPASNFSSGEQKGEGKRPFLNVPILGFINAVVNLEQVAEILMEDHERKK